ncbi:DUF481 domain-containing protein [Rosistilla ulvae]|uniref:DUF481 domain-containing protein n=1 Tax=Rosistilla ulvae TaxID=1930277 RepID=UPI001C54D6B9|nr:DUF481 domain-containing protein [Rosistilla ulvae]
MPPPAYQPGAYGSSTPTYLPPVNPTTQYPSIESNAPTGSQYSMPVQAAQQTQVPYYQAASDPNLYPQVQYLAAPAQNYTPPVPMNDPSILQEPSVVGSGASQETVPTPAPDSDSTVLDMSTMTPLPEQMDELEKEYSWYHYPWVWIPRDGWDSSVEFGLNGSEGNSNSLSYAAGANLARKSDLYNLGVNLNYRKTSSGGIDTQNNARANFDLDRTIAQSDFSAFIKSGLEYDEFKAFDARVNVNGGLSYFLAKTEDVTFVTRVGAGASQEIGSVDEDWKPEMLFGLDLKQQVNKRNKIYVKADYFPAFEDFSDYRVVTDAGWEILLDDAENFSLKLAATNRYDSTPLGLEPQDIDYTATLLYKF